MIEKRSRTIYLNRLPSREPVRARLMEQNARTGRDHDLTEQLEESLVRITNSIRHEVQGLYISRYVESEKAITRGVDESTLTTHAVRKSDEAWAELPSRLALVPGKRVLALLNSHLQQTYGISLSPMHIVGHFKRDEVPGTIQFLAERTRRLPTQSPMKDPHRISG